MYLSQKVKYHEMSHEYIAYTVAHYVPNVPNKRDESVMVKR